MNQIEYIEGLEKEIESLKERIRINNIPPLTPLQRKQFEMRKRSRYTAELEERKKLLKEQLSS